ncbi:hypothetical protein GCM10010400_71400 [Streptomyces aculeolatus]
MLRLRLRRGRLGRVERKRAGSPGGAGEAGAVVGAAGWVVRGRARAVPRSAGVAAVVLR